MEQKEIFHQLVQSPNGKNGQNWANLEPGASSGSPKGSQHLGYCLLKFQAHLWRAELEVEQPKFERVQCPYGMPALQAEA